MKISITLVLLLLSTIAFGQNNNKFNHVLTQSIIDRSNFTLKYLLPDGSSKVMKLGDNVSRKCILTPDGKGNINVDFWSIQDDINLDNPDIINKNTPLKAFFLTDNRKSVGDPTFVIKVPLRAWTWNFSTTPIRLRFKTDSSASTVSSALSLNASYGWTFGNSVITGRAGVHRTITLAPFIGLLPADLKKETVNTPQSWDSQKIGTRTKLALSTGGSVIFARNNLGLVFSVGIDHAFGEYSKKWSYQDKLWVGIGINTSIGFLK